MTNTNRTFKFKHDEEKMADALGLDNDYVNGVISHNQDRFNGIFRSSDAASEVIEAIHKFLNDDSIPNIDKTIMMYITFDTINKSNFSPHDTKEFVEQIMGES